MTTLMLNERAMRLAERMIGEATALRIAVKLTSSGARILDCGIKTEGGLWAGLLMARICLSDLGEVTLAPGAIGDIPCPHVQVTTDHPVLACMASQYAGWQIKVGKFFAMGSGPMRAAYGKEELFGHIPGREQAAVAVGVLETRKLPDDAVIDYLRERLNVAESQIVLLTAPTASHAGNLQVIARSVEMAMHKLHELKFDLAKVVSGYGVAPLPAVASDDLKAMGRVNDAIIYGGRVMLWLRATDEEIAAVGPKVPSTSSPDHGALFRDLFERSGGDFYKMDAGLFSPAQVAFVNLQSGRTHLFGKTDAATVRRSFFEGA
jgi:methenyltetrahydromethanopterin cyclohydrolase